MSKAELSLDKYGISSKRYKELCGFCEQYPEWKEELENDPVLQAVQYSDIPKSITNAKSDPTEQAAMRKSVIKSKVNLIETTAMDASIEFYKELIDNVCYLKPFHYLQNVTRMPASRNTFYRVRRYFFYLLSQRKV